MRNNIRQIKGYSNYLLIDGEVYSIKRDKFLNKTGKYGTITLHRDDGYKFTININRLLYAVDNNLSPHDIPRNLLIDKDGVLRDESEFRSNIKKSNYPLSEKQKKELIKLLDSEIDNSEKARIIFAYKNELKSYIYNTLGLVNDIDELASAAIDIGIQRVINSTFPTSLQGYLQGIARSLLQEKRRRKNEERRFINDTQDRGYIRTSAKVDGYTYEKH